MGVDLPRTGCGAEHGRQPVQVLLHLRRFPLRAREDHGVGSGQCAVDGEQRQRGRLHAGAEGEDPRRRRALTVASARWPRPRAGARRRSRQRWCTTASAARASPRRILEYRECRTFSRCPDSPRAADMVLSQTTLVTTRWQVVDRLPSCDVQASRFGRKVTPSGVVMFSGTSTDTHATPPPLSSPAEPMLRESSRMLATVWSNHSRYWWIW